MHHRNDRAPTFRSRIEAVCELPARRPRTALAVAAGLLVLSALALPRLGVDSSFASLLAPDTPHLAEMNQVRERTGGHRQLVVALSGLDRPLLDEVAQELSRRAAAREDVTSAYSDFDTSFFDANALWLLDDESVDELVHHVGRLVESARRPAFGSNRDTELTTRREAIEAIEAVSERARSARPDLELRTSDGRYRFVLIVPSVRVLEVEEAKATMAGLESTVADLVAEHPGLEARFTGRFALVLEQDAMLQRDMVVTAIVALLLCLLIVTVYFRSWRAPLILGGAIIVGAIFTLGLASVTVGSLNLISALLLPVLAGLGIDFGIHLATRYEQLRSTTQPAASAMRLAIRETRTPALVGGLTTAGAFLSLTLSEVRALSGFGALAAMGIVCTLFATYLTVPALLVMRDRRSPRPPQQRASTPASTDAPRSRRLWAIAIAALCLGLAGLGAHAAEDLRFENDYRMLGHSGSDAFFEYVDDNLEMRFDPSVMLLDTDEDLATARTIIERRRARANPRIDAVLGLDDFLPRRTPRRMAAIETLRELLAEPMLELTDAEEIAEARTLAAQRPWEVEALPSWVRERFVARDGEGAVMMLYSDQPIQSDREALRWNAELDALRAELDAAGVSYVISSEALLPAWIYMTMLDEGPSLIGAAASIVILIVLLYFFRRRGLRGVLSAGLVLVPLAAGVVCTAGAMASLGLNLTMFTLFVFPSVIGIGVDDLVHLVHRHDGRTSLRKTFRETAPAVVLTSLTTAAGFGASVVANHPGIASVGPVAVLAIACMTVAALVFLPALLSAFEAEVRAEVIAGYALLAGALAYVGTVIAAAIITPGYSHVTQLISELGEIGGPAAGLMSTMLIGVGVVAIGFAISLKNVPALATTSGRWLFAVIGSALVLGGLFPCDPTCAPVSFSGWAHLVTSFPAACASLAAPFVFGRHMRRAGWVARARVSYVLGALSILGIVLCILVFPFIGCMGLGQRVAASAPLAWMAFLAFCAIRPRSADSERFPKGPGTLEALRRLGDRRRPLELLARLSRDYGNLVGIRLLGQRICVVTDPALIDELLIKNASRIRQWGLGQFEPIFGRGLTTSEGELWRRQRRLLQPHFLKSGLARYEGAILSSARTTIDGWSDGDVVEVHGASVRLTTRIANRILFGHDSQEIEALVETTHHRLMAHFERALTGLSIPLRIPTPANLRLRREFRELDHAILDVIAARRTSGETGDDFLGSLLAACDDNTLVRDECLTMLMAASETTGAALSWTLHLLAQHPTIAEELAQAIDTVLGDSVVGDSVVGDSVVGDAAPTAAHLEHLPILNHVLKESMRLYTPVWASGRVATDDVTLGEHVLPAGTQIFFVPLLAHRDEQTFPAPMSFRPERWATRSADCPRARGMRSAFRPFGSGPRKCIGEHLGMLELSLLLIEIVRRFKIAPVPGEERPDAQASVTLRPRDGVRVRLYERRAHLRRAHSRQAHSQQARRDAAVA